jgi:uncharacterized delta-60 repeat protein
MRRALHFITGITLFWACSLTAQMPGSLDLGFAPATDFTDVLWGLAIQSDGKILASGRQGAASGVIYRLNQNGSVDPGFSSGARATCLDATIPQINTLSLQTNGAVVLGGAFTYLDSSVRLRLAQLSPYGVLDLAFTPSIGNAVFASAVQPDGKLIIGGNFVNVQGSGKNYLARLNPDGAVDSTFNPQGAGPQARVNAVALGQHGTIVIGGEFTSVNGIARLRVARLLSDGTVDTSFDLSISGPDSVVSAVAIQADRKVIIGGSFTQVGETPRGRIARLNENGNLDATFAPTSGCDSYVWAVAVQDNGCILAGGRFNNVNGEARSKIARFNPSGMLDSTFDPTAGSGAGTSDEIRALKLQSDGKIVVAGKFTTFSGQSRYGLARLHGDLGSPPLAALAVEHSSTNLILSWTGPYTLQSSTNAAGPYYDVTAATNPPCTIPIALLSEFFRLRE